VSIDPEREPRFLTLLADQYEPTQADKERVLAKILASSACAAPAHTRADVGAAAKGGRKSLLLGMSCVAMAFIGMMVFRTSVHLPSAPAGPALAAPPQASEPGRESETEKVPAVPSMSVDALPSTKIVFPSVKRVHSTEVQPPVIAAPSAPELLASPSSDTLEREARLLADARRALRAGNVDEALAVLDVHARTFPNGWLASDRAAEHILVLCSAGRRDEAVREANAFLEGRPKGPLTRRVEMSCAAQP